MYTRQQYLNKKCTHREYYKQFVDNAVLKVVEQRFTLDRLRRAYEEDENFNTIHLMYWDNLTRGLLYNWNVLDVMDKTGETYSLSTGVCILKAAARILVERTKESNG